MKKTVYKNVELTCAFQQANDLQKNECLQGVMSRNDKGFRFEEAVKHTRHHRNPKLYEGEHCSLVHRPNGKYQLHFKPFEVSGPFKLFDFSFPFYMEMMDALRIIERQTMEEEA